MTEYKNNLSYMFQEYSWEYFLTLNTETRDYTWMEQMLDYWRCNIRKYRKLDMGYQGVFNKYKNPHIHLLVNFSPSPTEQDIEKLKFYWSNISHRNLDIRKIYDVDGLIEYLSYQNTPYNNFELVKPIGTKGYLKKYQLN